MPRTWLVALWAMLQLGLFVEPITSGAYAGSPAIEENPLIPSSPTVVPNDLAGVEEIRLAPDRVIVVRPLGDYSTAFVEGWRQALQTYLGRTEVSKYTDAARDLTAAEAGRKAGIAACEAKLADLGKRLPEAEIRRFAAEAIFPDPYFKDVNAESEKIQSALAYRPPTNNRAAKLPLIAFPGGKFGEIGNPYFPRSSYLAGHYYGWQELMGRFAAGETDIPHAQRRIDKLEQFAGRDDVGDGATAGFADCKENLLAAVARFGEPRIRELAIKMVRERQPSDR